MEPSESMGWVTGSNELTTRWAGALDGHGGFVVSGACVWPLLALLASGAAGEGLAELTDAIGIDSADGITAALELVATLRSSPAASAAIGVWAAERVGLLPEWLRQLPPGTAGPLTGDSVRDQAALDRWAAEQTDGLIDSCPVTVGPATMVVLMSALLVRTTWTQPFVDGSMDWSGAPLAPDRADDPDHRVAGLSRWSDDLATASVIDHDGRPYGRFVCSGTDDIDVHLVSGAPEDEAGVVLAAAVAAIEQPHLAVSAAELPVGTVAGCLEVTEVTDSRGGGHDDVSVVVPRFDLAADHDLTRLAVVFGLRTVSGGGSHFPGIATEPLAVDAAVQRITAAFSREGFVAAAITAIAMLRGMPLPAEPRRHRRISVVHNRPFGFVAVHRDTGLVLVAGWVTDPEPLA